MAAAETSAPWPGRAMLPALAIGLCAGILPLLVRPLDLWMVAGGLCFLPVIWYGFAAARWWPLLFCAAAVLLPPVPFPWGDSGAHVSVLIAAAGVLGVIARLSEWRLEAIVLNAALVALFGTLALSLGFAALYSGAAIAAASAARLILLAAAVLVYFTASQGPGRQTQEEARRTARWLFFIAAAAALFGCVDFVYQFPAPAGFGAQFIWLSSGVYRRAQGLFYDASALGNFSAFFLVMCVVALAHRARVRSILPAPLACAGVVLFLAALLLSFSRASVGAAAIACMTLAFLERRRWARRKALITLLALAALAILTAAGFAIALPEFARGYWSRLGIGWDAPLSSGNTILSGRLDNWSNIAAFIFDHPWQTAAGIGYKTLPYTTHLGKPVIADNMYLSTLVETGVLGLAALLAVNASILAVCHRAAKAGSFYGTWMFCFWVGETFQMLAGDILTFWRVLPVFFWVLAQAVREAGPSGEA